MESDPLHTAKKTESNKIYTVELPYYPVSAYSQLILHACNQYIFVIIIVY